MATGQRRACVRGADEAERRALGMLRLGFSAANICFFFIWARVSAVGLGSGLVCYFVIGLLFIVLIFGPGHKIGPYNNYGTIRSTVTL